MLPEKTLKISRMDKLRISASRAENAAAIVRAALLEDPLRHRNETHELIDMSMEISDAHERALDEYFA